MMAMVLLLAALATATPPSPEEGALAWGSAVAMPGQRVHGYLPVPDGPGGPASIPVTVVRGSRPGPVVAVMAGIHGSEYVPILAVQRLAARLNPAELSGTVVLVHIANVPAFLHRTVYYGPTDWKNLNRVFPGSATGTLSERMAHVLTQEIFGRVDASVDVHCGDANEALLPYTAYIANALDLKVSERSRAMALAFGVETVKARWADFTGPTRYTTDTAVSRGIPAIGVELGGEGRTPKADISRVEEGLVRVLRALGLVPGGPPPPVRSRFVTYSETVSSPVHGLFTLGVRVGQRVAAGAPLGVIRDAFGRTLAVPGAPFAGEVLYAVTTPPISPGEPLVSLGITSSRAPESPPPPPAAAPRVLLNHVYVVLDAEHFEALRGSEFFLREFAEVDAGLPAFRPIQATDQRLYVRGQDTYLELLGPENPFKEPVGKVGVGLSVEQEGELKRLVPHLKRTLGERIGESKAQWTFEGRGQVPWYDAIHGETSERDASLALWVSEYHAGFFQALYPERPWDAHDVSRRAFMGPRFKPERLLRDITGLTLELSPERAAILTRELVAMGYRQTSAPGDVLTLEGGGVRWSLRESSRPRGLLEMTFSLTRVKQGPRVVPLKGGARLDFSADSPDARWVLVGP
ncbi:hypothetical protein F0U60_24775 [Archangium minus]|uniref:Succinylglutamate desuccinylase/Aspartoacylase catalytic domain-containing protein n=1 Tax=Archangium minus TaxID=83450 RepID=A0ABY9WTN9_9BACT|nr:hypothetical protein F0U60_24775 [Archangium minus]